MASGGARYIARMRPLLVALVLVAGCSTDNTPAPFAIEASAGSGDAEPSPVDSSVTDDLTMPPDLTGSSADLKPPADLKMALTDMTMLNVNIQQPNKMCPGPDAGGTNGGGSSGSPCTKATDCAGYCCSCNGKATTYFAEVCVAGHCAANGTDACNLAFFANTAVCN